MIGLSGAHRTGKTTLAQTFAKQYGFPFVRTSATEVFSILGKDPKAEYPIGERISIQESILYAFEKQYAQARTVSDVFVADRTPIDLISYLLADVQRGTTEQTPELSLMINNYVDRCFESASQWFSVIALVQPGIALVEDPGKAQACPAYIEHLNALQMGLLLDPRLHARHYAISRQVTDLQARVESLRHVCEHATSAGKQEAATRTALGILVH